MFTATALPILAQSMDAATQSQAFVFLGGLAAAAFLGNQIMGAMLNFRKLKGADAHDEKRFVSQAEHQALRDEVIGIKSDFSALARTINNSFGDLQRSIGRLEGKLDGKPSRGNSAG